MERRSERATVRRQTEQLLGNLGASPGQVASTLVEGGVRGLPANSRDCAVAVYLGAVIGADSRVRGVKVCKSEVLIERAGWWRRSVVVPLPTSVRQFIAAFDARTYPELLRGDGPAVPPGALASPGTGHGS